MIHSVIEFFAAVETFYLVWHQESFIKFVTQMKQFKYSVAIRYRCWLVHEQDYSCVAQF